MTKLIAEVGDKIQWTFNEDKNTSKMFRGKTYTAEVAMIDVDEGHYGVYADCGQDLIPFSSATII